MSSTVRHDAGPRVVFPFAGRKPGGSHISTFTLAQALKEKLGIDVVVAAPESTKVAAEARRFNLKVKTNLNFPLDSGPGLRDAAYITRRIAFLRSLGTNTLLHANDIWNLRAWYLPCRIARIPMIYHHRAFERSIYANQVLLRGASRLISISDACTANLQTIVDRPIAKITNPFAFSPETRGDAVRADLLSKLLPTRRPKLVGFVANLQTRKRPDFFVEVAAAIIRQEPDARFVVFGSERDISIPELRYQAEQLDVAHALIFAGFRSTPEANIAALDLLVAPALAEPFGRTLVEAILVGTPYVATCDAGHTEIYERWKGGLVIPADATASDFATACLRVIHEPTAVRLGPSEHARIVNELSPLHHARAVLKIYQELVPPLC